MKSLRWFKLGDQIPSSANYLGAKRQVVTKWGSGVLGPMPRESHFEYLYEVYEGMTDKQKSPEEVVQNVAHRYFCNAYSKNDDRDKPRLRALLLELLRERDAYLEKRVGELVGCSEKLAAFVRAAIQPDFRPGFTYMPDGTAAALDELESAIAKFRESK